MGAVLIHGADDADELVADDGDAGRCLKFLDERFHGGIGGEQTIRACGQIGVRGADQTETVAR